MIKEITSIKNKTISEIKKLKLKKYREQSGTFLVEGYRNVCDSMQKAEAVFVFYEADFSEPLQLPDSCECYRVTAEVLKELADTKTPQGIIGVFRIPKETVITSDCVLLLNGVSDPGNLGTILRTALATGFSDIILDEKCADVYAPKVVRSAMSAVFSLNLVRVKELKDKIAELKQQDYCLFAGALTDTAKSLYELEFPKKTALLFGSEANGISPEILQLADIPYIIPMNPEIESLNVAVAAGISMYEVLRKNNTSKEI